MTARDMLLSLRSLECPGCGGHKARSKSVCSKCWRLLTRKQQVNLYRFFGEGYEDAFTHALAWIKQRRIDAGSEIDHV